MLVTLRGSKAACASRRDSRTCPAGANPMRDAKKRALSRMLSFDASTSAWVLTTGPSSAKSFARRRRTSLALGLSDAAADEAPEVRRSSVSAARAVIDARAPALAVHCSASGTASPFACASRPSTSMEATN
eukprot:scaffold995_cov244-Pinguiococcus_pyrenoidosus.AAC.8